MRKNVIKKKRQKIGFGFLVEKIVSKSEKNRDLVDYGLWISYGVCDWRPSRAPSPLAPPEKESGAASISSSSSQQQPDATQGGSRQPAAAQAAWHAARPKAAPRMSQE
jgi:hypothetical protein